MTAVRNIEPDEVAAFLRTTWTAFGENASDAVVTAWAEAVEPDRAFAAFDGDAIVASGCTFTMALTVPGLAEVDAGGLSMVGVLPSHRRRGILRSLMAAHLRDVRDRGEPVGILTASESSIYARFGYGPATYLAEYLVDTRAAAFAGEPPERSRVRMCGRDEIERLAPHVQERSRSVTPGEVRATDRLWPGIWADLDDNADDGAWLYAVHEDEAGQPDGYALWRVVQRWDNGLPDNQVRGHIDAASDATRLSLWRFLLELDLAAEVRAFGPLDEPLRWRLADPRRLRTAAVSDHLWVRLVDVAAALASRRYESEGDVVVEVLDAFQPDSVGTYRLEGGPDGAACGRSDRDADLVLDASTLGSLYLGGVSAERLRRAGRVEERREGAASRLDAMFNTAVLPYCGTEF